MSRRGGAVCRLVEPCCCRCRNRDDGVNDPAAVPGTWPQDALTGSFTPSVVVPRVAVSRAKSVQENRAARMHICAARCGHRSAPSRSADIGSRSNPVLLKNTTTITASTEADHHRVDDPGAVLDVVNALRSASTWPLAGPSGIDDVSARHGLATARWWSIWTAHNAIDATVAQAYLGLITPVPQRHSSGSPHWHPERAFRRRPSGAVCSAPFTTSQPSAGPPRAGGRRACEL